MTICKNSKISEFIVSTISEDPDYNVKLSSDPSEFDANYVEIMSNFSNWLHRKFYEFSNTISRVFFRNFIERRKCQETLAVKTNLLLNFCKRNSVTSHKLEKNNTNNLFLDVTFTMEQANITGIPRVVNQIAKYGQEMGVIPVFLYKSCVYRYDFATSVICEVIFKENDIFIHADAGWNYPVELQEVLKNISAASGNSVVVIYDLIPLIYPELSNQHHVEAFKNWINVISLGAKEFICISKSVADDFVSLVQTEDFHCPSVQSVGWAHLGSNLGSNEVNTYSSCSKNILISKPYFLSVGTVEPRKAYAVALEAMEQLWSRNLNVSYAIVGRYGWSQAKLKDKILSHREYGKRLFWYDSASDSELQFLYCNALALVSTSLCEGFGLPVIEAAHYSLSSIVSDIPVFREIGGRSTQYFEVTNSRELAILLEITLQRPKIVPDLTLLNWQQAVSNLFRIIERGEYQYELS